MWSTVTSATELKLIRNPFSIFSNLEWRLWSFRFPVAVKEISNLHFKLTLDQEKQQSQWQRLSPDPVSNFRSFYNISPPLIAPLQSLWSDWFSIQLFVAIVIVIKSSSWISSLSTESFTTNSLNVWTCGKPLTQDSDSEHLINQDWHQLPGQKIAESPGAHFQAWLSLCL